VHYIDTPHTPHGWDAGVMFEESTGTLLCGDLSPSSAHNRRSFHGGDVVGRRSRGRPVPVFGAQSGMVRPSQVLPASHRAPLGAMHGPSFAGDGRAALNALGDEYDRRAGERWQAMLASTVRSQAA